MILGSPMNGNQESQGRENAERTSSRAVYRPLVDIIETPDAVLLMADLPGVDERETDVQLDKKVLTIRGRVQPATFDGYTLAYSEYGVGDFERAFTVSDEIDREEVQATVKNGVLKVLLPKSRQTASKKISVFAG